MSTVASPREKKKNEIFKTAFNPKSSREKGYKEKS
jgi:hypothetical protein